MDGKQKAVQIKQSIGRNSVIKRDVYHYTEKEDRIERGERGDR